MTGPAQSEESIDDPLLDQAVLLQVAGGCPAGTAQMLLGRGASRSGQGYGSDVVAGGEMVIAAQPLLVVLGVHHGAQAEIVAQVVDLTGGLVTGLHGGGSVPH